MLWIVVAVVAILVVAGVAAWARARRSVHVVAVPPAEADGVVGEPVPVAPTIRWAQQFASRGELDDAARLKLINDLGFLRAAWCVPLLSEAYREERDPALRAAALDALEACDPDAAVALRAR
ncbi:MAG TPA: hypothetical protein VFB22_00560 [Candidatus Baltobacteraceae bacterium]|nr:hypothetical protein [Candidatus Baltobacteraceae bacterium]